MAKKDDFDFDIESEGKGKFDLIGFFKNLTKKQKTIILSVVIGVVAIVAIVLICVALFGGNNNEGNYVGGVRLPSKIESISLSSAPDKTSYFVGEAPDYSGLSVFIDGKGFEDIHVNYDKNPGAFTFSGFDSSAPAEKQVITVTCGGKTATFTVKIREFPEEAPKLLSIEVVPPTKTEYKLHDPFSLKGGKIICTYDNGDVKETPIRLDNVSGYEAMENGAGEYVITVTYRDGPVTLTDSYTVIVTE